MQAKPTSKPQTARQIAELAELIDDQGGDVLTTLGQIERDKGLSLSGGDRNAVLIEVWDRRGEWPSVEEIDAARLYQEGRWH